MVEVIFPIDYNERMKEYNKKVAELEAKRKKFYEENPNFPIKTMYMNVIAPPQKVVIIDTSEELPMRLFTYAI